MAEIIIQEKLTVEIKEETKDCIEDGALYFYTDRIRPDEDQYDPPKWLSDSIQWMMHDALNKIDPSWREKYHEPWNREYDTIDDLDISDVYIIPRSRIDTKEPFTMDEIKKYEKSCICHVIHKIKKKKNNKEKK